jgi:lipopolysaccharide/colanic/teichoic acid biosynthesis glycosyltransferase
MNLSTTPPPKGQEEAPAPEPSSNMKTKAPFRIKKRYLFYLADPLLILVSAIGLGLFFKLDVLDTLVSIKHPITLYLILWMLGSALLRKERVKPTIEKTLNTLVKKNIAIHVTIVLLYYYLDVTGFRWYFLSLFVLITFLEMVGFRLFTFTRVLAEVEEDEYLTNKEARINTKDNLSSTSGLSDSLQMLIVGEIGLAAFEFINKHMGQLHNKTLFLSTSTRFNILQQPDNTFEQVVILKAVNKAGRINKFFEAINSKIPNGGKLIGFTETPESAKIRIMQRYPKGINYIAYAAYYLWHQAFPKIYLLREFYFIVTTGKHRVLSKAETFGRLYSCGFEITGEAVIKGQQFFVAEKVKEPSFDENPTYGPLISLNRHGKNGKLIKVYKFRSMYPFSEYLQSYVYQQNQLDKGGKFKDDFRVTAEGKLLRKFWLDELPMLLNVLKGEMKIVGVRPLSKHYFNLYTKELQEKRIKHKPGLIPPFYVDLPETLEDIMASEMRYLEKYEQNPILTDWTYFWGAIYNIFVKKARSK